MVQVYPGGSGGLGGPGVPGDAGGAPVQGPHGGVQVQGPHSQGFQQLTVQHMLEAWMDNVRRDMMQRQDSMIQGLRMEMQQTRPPPPSPGEGELWPASFLLSNIRGLVGMSGNNKSPFLHDLATQRNCLWVAVTDLAS